MSSGPSGEHGICVQTRGKDFELYFSNAADANRWLQAFERALLTAKVSQDAHERKGMYAPPELNRAVSASSAVEHFDSASTAATSGKATPTQALDEAVQVIDAAHEIPPAPAHSTQPCLATSLQDAEMTTQVEASGGLEPPKAWSPSPQKTTTAQPQAKNYTDHGAGMTVQDRLAALEFSDYGSDSDLGDMAAADQILGELDAAATATNVHTEEVQSVAIPAADETHDALAQDKDPGDTVTLLRENSWDAPSPKKVELIREHSWDD